MLVILSEECSEIAQRATKAIRFGMDDSEPGQDKNNLTRLVEEIHDLIAVLKMLGIGISVWNETMISNKIEKVEHYLKYSQKLGMVETDETTVIQLDTHGGVREIFTVPVEAIDKITVDGNQASCASIVALCADEMSREENWNGFDDEQVNMDRKTGILK